MLTRKLVCHKICTRATYWIEMDAVLFLSLTALDSVMVQSYLCHRGRTDFSVSGHDMIDICHWSVMKKAQDLLIVCSVISRKLHIASLISVKKTALQTLQTELRCEFYVILKA
ncbi:unnamed protein product [Owenia fusiformis]|uniref:Uncharacterized protein n=1 Tax=Owenia fusiformis TaxID=6347 RepID=A0A8S4Q7U5_OWEFU|nr:unnamed protein product [Owenia fusiformis]